MFHTGVNGGVVRDATKVGPAIQAVGTWLNPDAANKIYGALWTIDTATNAVTRQTLPDPCLPSNVSGPCAQNLAAGNAITPDGSYIASQAHSTIPTTAVRVATPLGPLSNTDLTPTSLFPTGGTVVGAVFASGGRQATAISDSGTMLYGQVNVWLGLTNPNQVAPNNKIFQGRVYRFDSVGFGQIRPQPATVTKTITVNGVSQTGTWQILQSMTPRAVSSDGLIAVGTTFTDAPVPDAQAFRYVYSAGGGSVVDIPRAPGGISNTPIALSNDGNLTALIGDSTAYPNGEVYLYNAATTARTYLGSPNAAMTLQSIGGISNDGAVVALSARACAPAPCQTQEFYGYFHNSHGWFHLASALANGGASLAGWERLSIQGMNGDASLVWGAGVHDGVQEGFVAEFETDYLKNFNPQAAAPLSTALVGIWTESPDPGNPDGIVAFMADGTYYQVQAGGYERGLYTFDGTTVSLLTTQDLNGTLGLSDTNGSTFGLTITGDTGMASDGTPIARIVGTPGSLIGGWHAGDASQNDNSAIVVFTTSGKYFMAQDGDPATDPGGHDGVEVGTATWNLVDGTYSLQSNTIFTDTNGEWGLSHPFGTIRATLDPDGLNLQAGDDSGTESLARVIDPASVAQVSGGAAAGTLGAPFTYQVSALRAEGYGATGLPAGLGINGTTGEISGTPGDVGFFPVTLFAGNTFGAPRTATLNLTIASVAQTDAGAAVVVTPVVPDGSPAISLTFDEVAAAGETTVAVLDPEVAPTEPPSGFQFGDPPQYYEIETTAVLAPNTSVTMCFSYAGIDFGGNTPRLFHYVTPTWVDITTSVDTATQTLCGATSSFSPFAIFASPATFQKGFGFYAPVSPLAGFINAAKAGATVPLKFNVTVNGIQKTDTAGLVFSTSPIACTVAPEDPVDYVTADGTNLRWADGQFIQNWKTPRTPGCYVARITSADGLMIKAAFRLK